MFHIRSARRTVDSKIDENRCKQKYELIQVMCRLIMISGVRHNVLKIKIHIKLRSLNYTNNSTPPEMF